MILREHRERLIAYLESCLAREDWHGVADAANDLRVVEANGALSGLRAAMRAYLPPDGISKDELIHRFLEILDPGP